MEKFHKANLEAYEAGKSIAKVVGFQSFFSTFGINCCMALIIWYGSELVKKRKISVGDISAFLLYMI